jgi:shikimate dehydrogenase
MTDRYAVIGHPVLHSKSPWIHAEFARATRQDLDYRAIEAPLDSFERTADAFRASGGRGANVTLPFKEAAYRYCAATSARAQAAGAVNTLLFEGGKARGDNTDGAGLVRDLTANLGVALAGRRVLVMGAGGAARGVLAPLLEAGVARIAIANRTAERARALAARFPGSWGGGYAELAAQSFDLIVNATSAGLAGELPALPPAVFAPGALAYEMVYGRDTPFLELARGAGARVADGSGMLVEQAAESFLLWRGLRPDTRAVLAALRTG